MKTFNSSTTQNIVYADYSSSGIAASIADSSAVPTNLSSIMLNTNLVIQTIFLPKEKTELASDELVREDIKKSIEKSLKDNSEVWDELSKH